MEYKILKVKDLNEFAIREIRQNTIDKLKERINKHGYNNSRPLTIVKKDNKYFVADGNHRLKVLNELNIIEVPCLIIDDDIYKIAVNNNLDEDTYSKMDLFDWLDIISKMKDEGYKLKKIAEKLNFSEQTIKYYNSLLKKVSTILDLTKESQEGRETKKFTVETFNFTERWFRDSGLYDLTSDYQLKFFESFKESKFKWNKNKVQQETAKLKLWQEFIKISKAKLVNENDLTIVIELIENNNFKTENQLLEKIKDLNNKASNKLINGDALIELEKLNDCSIDLVVTDPPYGIDYCSNRSQYKDHITKNKIKNDKSEAFELLDKTCEILNRKTKSNSHFYFFTSWKVYSKFEEIISKYFNIKNMIVWDKGNHGSGDLENSWGNRHELIIFATKGNRSLTIRKADILNISKVQSNKMIHPTQKPIELITEILKVSSQKADTICDPFMGSGSIIKATKKYKNLNYIGIEIDKNYFEIAKNFIGEDNG
jgi:site-specific DNA-methyltransferase (adenine-specific)